MMATNTPTLHPEWVTPARDGFQAFLRVTKCPHPVRNGTRGSAFDDPEWLIMFMAIVSVKAHVKDDLPIGLQSSTGIGLLRGWTGAHARHPSQRYSLRDRFKKICHAPGKSAACIMQDFPQEVLDGEGQCVQDDGQSQRSGLAPEPDATGPHAARMAGAGLRGYVGKIPGRQLNLRP
jgi:hypothetical protein